MGNYFPYRQIYFERKIPETNSYKEQYYIEKKIININKTIAVVKREQHISNGLLQMNGVILSNNKTMREQGVKNRSILRIVHPKHTLKI